MNIYKYNRIKILITSILCIILISIFAINYLEDIGGYITIILLTLFIGSILIKKQLSYRIYMYPTHLNIEYFIVNSNETMDIYWNKITKVRYTMGMVIVYENNKKTYITRSVLNFKSLYKELYEQIKIHNKESIVDKSFLDYVNSIKN